MAEEDELSTFSIALWRSTAGFQAETVPSSVTKINRAGLPEVTSKSELPLKTAPVGAAGLLPPEGGGMVTTKGTIWPVPLYSVETPVPLSATHHGLVELRARPQGFTRLGSVVAASFGISETRSVWR